MINSKFLAPPLRVAGLEFMDFQSSNFYKELVTIVTPLVVDGHLSKLPKKLNDVIKKYTGFENITFLPTDKGNLSIDTGYISPGNVLDLKGIQYYYPKSQSTLYRWFRSNQANFMYGTLDLTTGKVGGAYSTFPFHIFFNRDLNTWMSDTPGQDQIKAERWCTFLVHELGHAFAGILAIHRAVVDNYAITSAVHWMSDAEYGQSHVAIYEDALRLMEIDKKHVKDLKRIAEEGSTEVIITSLTKLAQQRTQFNSQSLGVGRMNSETLADVYAVRMGCDKRLIEGVKGMHDSYDRLEGIFVVLFSLVMGGFAMIAMPAIAAFMATAFFTSLATSAVMLGAKLVPTEYDTPYRRLLTVYQEQILRLKSSQHISDADKRKMLADLDEAKAIVDSAKHFFEDTAIQRLWLQMYLPGNTRFDQLEHYTKMVLNNEQSVVNAKFQLLGKKD